MASACFGPPEDQLAAVQRDLGYDFKDKWLLRQAFVHPSAGQFNFTRLAWIGDAAMGLVVSQLVFASSNCADCETLHDRRKVMVTREYCAEACKKLGWEKYVVVGKGYAKNDAEVSMKMRGELFEAVWGALFIDSGGDYAAVLTSYEKHFPLEALAPVFAKIEAVRKEAEKARNAAKKVNIAAEKARGETAEALDANMVETIPEPGTPVISEEEKSKVSTVLDQLLCGFLSE